MRGVRILKSDEENRFITDNGIKRKISRSSYCLNPGMNQI